MGFCHLHLHSEYSLLDGACRIEEIPKKAKELGHTACAITDHGVMYGVVDFYLACKKYDIKPIIGCEVYVAPNSRFDKTNQKRYHLILLVKNEIGYKNLIYLVSKSYIDGFYIKPRIDLELLKEHHEGLICLSACLAGYISQSIMAGDFEKAKEHALFMKQLFKDDYYLEIQNHGLEAQVEVNEGIYELSKETGIPLVATNDVHYLNKEDADTQAILMCIQTNNKIADGRPFGFETDEFYYKSTEEMSELFKEHISAVNNTEIIASKCSYDFDFSKLYLPKYKVEGNDTPDNYLKKLAYDGFEEKIKNGDIIFDEKFDKKTYIDRIEYELSVISKMGYSEYYLIVYDFINASRQRNISTGPGRGSGAGSLVAYLVGITEVDSIKYNLMFERFLNPERVSMPDFDTDFDYVRRDEVIKYVTDKYGENNVSGIITFGTLAAKAVVKDVGRAMGMSFSTLNRVTNLIPNDLNVTLTSALDGKLKDEYEKDEEIKKLIDVSLKLEGMPRHASAHAAGIVISDSPIYNIVPMTTGNDMLLTQFPMDTIAKLGLLKFDFLGLRYLTIISDTEKFIKISEPNFDIHKIDYNDTKTFELLSQGNTDGVFQLESAGIKKLLMQMQPKKLEDIIIVLSLYRPGPMDSIPTYLNNRNHPNSIEYKVPCLKPILEETSGCIVYQEQVMQICREIAGYSYGRADIIRRAMSKKKADVMEKEREAFINGAYDENGNEICPGAIKNGVDAETATEIFDTMSSFASYAFNKSHATAYAILSYRTAYLKAHYPCEFFSSLLTSVLGDIPKTAHYIDELKKYNIKVMGPDINLSDEYYTIVNTNNNKIIRFGLLGIKNVGISFLNNLISERENGKFTSFIDFIKRMRDKDLNKRQIEALIKCGVFDSFDVNRAQLLSEYENIINRYVKQYKETKSEQLSFFSFDEIDETQIDDDYIYPEMEDFPLNTKLKMEKECSGMYLSGHPIEQYSNNIEYLNSFDIEAIYDHMSDGQKCVVSGIITNREIKNTKNNDEIVFITLQDRTNEIECIIFSKLLNNYRHLLSVNNCITIIGKVSISYNEEIKIVADDIIELLDNQHFVKPSNVDNNKPNITTEKKEKTLYLKLPNFNEQLIYRLQAIFSLFKGSNDVILYNSETKEYKKEKDLQIKFDDNMILLLKKILGNDCVIIK